MTIDAHALPGPALTRCLLLTVRTCYGCGRVQAGASVLNRAQNFGDGLCSHPVKSVIPLQSRSTNVLTPHGGGEGPSTGFR